MRTLITSVILLLFSTTAICFAQGKGQGPSGALSVPDNPQAVGDAGVAWYTTWDTGLEEAKRSNRPIFFMSAATTCSGVSGVF